MDSPHPARVYDLLSWGGQLLVLSSSGFSCLPRAACVLVVRRYGIVIVADARVTMYTMYVHVDVDVDVVRRGVHCREGGGKRLGDRRWLDGFMSG